MVQTVSIGTEVIVYDRYLFAVPVKGQIIDISEKDGAYAVKFFKNNPGGTNVTKHNGKFFHHEQCRMLDEVVDTVRPDPQKTKGPVVNVRWNDGYLETFDCSEVRFGSDLLWMRLKNGSNRHIPLRQVRWFSTTPESHEKQA